MEPTTPESHRRLGIEANTSIWALLELTGRTEDESEDLLGRTYASSYHWRRAQGFSPENLARAEYLIGKAWLSLGQTDLALRYGDRVLATCETAGLRDFDLAYAHELRARCLRALGRDPEAEQAWSRAISITIAEEDDREIIEQDFADW